MTNSEWSLVALILFFVLLGFLGVHRRLGKALDDRANGIRREIEEARALKEESKRQLAEFQRRRKEAEDEAKAIVEGARREAEMMLAEAKAKTEDYVARRTAMAEQKISQAEHDALAEVRSSAVEIAVAAAARIISERGTAQGDAALVDRSISEVRNRLN